MSPHRFALKAKPMEFVLPRLPRQIPAFRISSRVLRATLAMVCALLALLSPKLAFAHPHEWIEMKVEILFNDKGKAVAMRHDWTMDEFFSAYAVSDIDAKNGKPTEKALDELMKEMLTNISEIGFFIKASHSGASVPLLRFEPVSLTMPGRNLRMQFVLPFLGALDLSQAPLAYKVYDPEYYIEMLHIEGPKPIILAGAPKGCRWDLVPPSDNQSMAAYASSLGIDEAPTIELGAFFAEEASIKCQ
ncbi:MAG: DUF1007 family protein [Pseudomonadota bacterium]